MCVYIHYNDTCILNREHSNFSYRVGHGLINGTRTAASFVSGKSLAYKYPSPIYKIYDGTEQVDSRTMVLLCYAILFSRSSSIVLVTNSYLIF